ncbi:MAG: hypothetical protein JSS44_02490 [Proteobacteria bacterium]|nr:hypothetical protein [Pseudomonadota bacterium]MBS0462235.1 hypothetical protein [Pseudomonadota bacterium]MBS0465343.1 hypothetical protein [Pseudomonadota bacterium]
MRATRFTDPAAVDAWDQYFRWREGGRLRDRTIDATWTRVAQALAASGGADVHDARRYADAFSAWQLVPDERLLALAGTGQRLDRLDDPCAQVNVAAFVFAPGAGHAHFDEEGFLAACVLAVRLLDDALLMVHGRLPTDSRLRVGLLGFADALALLGIEYGQARSVQFAQRLGRLLDRATLLGMFELLEERGGGATPPSERLQQWRRRGSPADLIEAIGRRGQRHRALTTLAPCPRLALLANAASASIEPRGKAAPANARTAGRGAGTVLLPTAGPAQAAIRAAIAPWVDEPD